MAQFIWVFIHWSKLTAHFCAPLAGFWANFRDRVKNTMERQEKTEKAIAFSLLNLKRGQSSRNDGRESLENSQQTINRLVEKY
jgi:hypothetical protein